MKNTLSIVGALTFATTLTVGAQSETPVPAPVNKDAMSKDTSMTGCLEKTKSGGFWLTKVTPSMPTAVGTSGTSPNVAPVSPSRSAAESMTLNLEHGTDLDVHVGHTIEVTGKLKSENSGDKLTGSKTESEMKARDFEVNSVKMVAATCV